MIDGIEGYYQRIADSIVNAVREEWSVAILHALFYADSCTYEAEYVRKVDGRAISLGTEREAERAIRELRKAFRVAGHRVWGQLLFVLQADGTFNCKWSYDGCDANGDLPFDEQEELKRFENRRLRLIAGKPRAHEVPTPPM